MKKLIVVVLCFFAFPDILRAQDAQMSQYYAAPLYVNPAFTGGGYAPRIMANYRNQWPSLNANFVTSIFAIDDYFESAHSGVGLMILNDNQGNRIKNTEISALYSYQQQIGETNFIRAGLQATYSSRGFDNSNLIWGDQIGPNGYNGSASQDPLSTANGIKNINFFDVSSGFLYYNPNMFFGLAIHHITNPALSFANDNNPVHIGRAINVNGGYNINLGQIGSLGADLNREFVLTPTFLYKRQAQFSQLDLGFYGTYSPFTLGVFYRGIPIKGLLHKFPNQDAFSGLIGYRMDNFSVGYSYDFTISKLSNSNTGGSHEISVSYVFERPEQKDSYHYKKRKKLSCPKF